MPKSLLIFTEPDENNTATNNSVKIIKLIITDDTKTNEQILKIKTEDSKSFKPKNFTTIFIAKEI